MSSCKCRSLDDFDGALGYIYIYIYSIFYLRQVCSGMFLVILHPCSKDFRL